MTDTRSSLLMRIVNDPHNDAAWREFFGLYDPVIRAYLLRRSADRGLRCDDDTLREVTQVVRIKLFCALPKFRLEKSVGRFRTWLFQVTVNALADRRRSAARRSKEQQTLGDTQVDLNTIREQGETPDEAWEKLYQEAVYKAAVEEVRQQTLPKNPAKWRSFEEHKLRGRSAPDVAKELKIETNAVYQNALRVFREIEQLCLVKYEESLADAAV